MAPGEAYAGSLWMRQPDHQETARRISRNPFGRSIFCIFFRCHTRRDRFFPVSRSAFPRIHSFRIIQAINRRRHPDRRLHWFVTCAR